jgi:hypothetical protein
LRRSGATGRPRQLQAAATTLATALRSRQQQVEGDELLLGKQHRLGKHNPAAAAAGGILRVEGQHHTDRFGTLRTTLQMTKENAAGQGEQVTAVDPVETQGGGGISTGPADLEGGTARGTAAADGTTRFRRRKCSCGAQIKR